MSAPNTRLSGLGALFFVGTLGAIAFYVQRQEVPETHDVVRTAATGTQAAPEEAPVAALPWQDRLDLAAATPAPLGPDAPTPTKTTKSADPDFPSLATDLARTRLVQELSDGHRILYTLDPVLQDAALQIFRNREVPYAAAVVLDVRDNAVLALAGHSSMDPEVDPLEIVTTAWAPAASTFKLVTAASLLANKHVNNKTRVCFSGGLHGITDDLLLDDPRRDERCDDLGGAVAHSHNVVIAKLALKHLSADALQATVRSFKFDSDIPFEFPVERSPALIPADAKERAKVAAGFWHVDMSPLHGALLASVFARDGVYQAPHVISQVLGPDGTDRTPGLPKTERVLSKDVAEAVGAMMVRTTTEGTARASFVDRQGNSYIADLQVAGKTGSLTGKRAPGLNYNWFVGYAPADRPEIAFAVLLANEPKWQIKAHYAARRLVQIYAQRRDAIADHRVARLTKKGVELPVEGKKSAPAASPSKPAPPDAVAARKAPAARPDPDALPPVPGPVARPQAASGKAPSGV
ncbi:penicillin-binding transpeptidase domain-containing protein [Nannocystis radixulma]|uniref:Penicillin-binding transpeptidase domain-containing protein n=1 Tax=Nannocystis radixulma TaxID=2995305 RepID=A0ABT5BAP0_9BACT|nr:penicillin-binding transpeptidase domain-containing protein [Nannocystis radixulma]MDC0671192.1 penicillin-binding transpeptidase domain-containing protein [Nannocystis radixulma]